MLKQTLIIKYDISGDLKKKLDSLDNNNLSKSCGITLNSSLNIIETAPKRRKESMTICPNGPVLPIRDVECHNVRKQAAR